MKKILKYNLIIMCIVVIIPILCTKKRTIIKNEEDISKENETQNETQNEIAKYDYSKYKNIKLYHKNSGEIEELPLDEYLYGVVSAEMPASYEIEALKAQAVVARTYTIYQIANSKRKT